MEVTRPLLLRLFYYVKRPITPNKSAGSVDPKELPGFFHTFSMALYHKQDVKNDFAYTLQFFSLISDGLGGVCSTEQGSQLKREGRGSSVQLKGPKAEKRPPSKSRTSWPFLRPQRLFWEGHSHGHSTALHCCMSYCYVISVFFSSQISSFLTSNFETSKASKACWQLVYTAMYYAKVSYFQKVLLVSSNLPKNLRIFFQDFCPSLQ